MEREFIAKRAYMVRFSEHLAEQLRKDWPLSVMSDLITSITCAVDGGHTSGSMYLFRNELRDRDGNIVTGRLPAWGLGIGKHQRTLPSDNVLMVVPFTAEVSNRTYETTN